MRRPFGRSERGQVLPLFALMLVVLLLAAGLMVDVGWALSQQRTAQNAADFAALAGTRVLGEFYTNKPAGAGTDQNVSDAVNAVLAANHSQLVSATYVDSTGAALVSVGGGSIPTGAAGVVVNAKTTWKPFFLGIIGVSQWSAGTTAAAATQAVATGGVLPIGIEDTAFNELPKCDLTSTDPAACVSANKLTPGSLILPGGFGWLSFGAQKSCTGYGLGMSATSGCATSQGFLQGEVGPPANSYGCCTDLTLTPDAQRLIGNMTGNKLADLSYYITNQIPVWVPIWGPNADNTIAGSGSTGSTAGTTSLGSPRSSSRERIRSTGSG